MKPNLRPIFILILLLLTSRGVKANESEIDHDMYSVCHISMKEGLSHNFVEDLFQDSKGFVWIATSGSLARHDGYEFVNFTPNSITRHIKSSFVRKMTEDRFGRLWTASDGGIDVIDINTLTPLQITDNTGKFAEIATNPTGYISTDSSGNIWLRNPRDIVRISFNSEGAIEKIRETAHKGESTLWGSAVQPVNDNKKSVLSVVGGMICSLTVNADRITATPLDVNLKVENDVYVSDFLINKEDLWISTEIGLLRHNTRTKETRLYQNIPGQEGSLSQNFITDLGILPDGSVIAASLNGLNAYNDRTDTFTVLRICDFEPSASSLNFNFINSLLVDNDKIWLGTEGCGANILFPKTINARLWRHDEKKQDSLSPNPVNSIYEDSDGNLWIGTVEGGLNRAIKNPDNGFAHFTMASGALTHNSVSAITGDREGHLWVGTWGGGVNVLDRLNPTSPLKTFQTTTDGSCRLDYIGSVIYDPFNNAIWIGANSGIYLYDFASDSLTVPFPGATEFKGSVASLISPEGKLWIGGLDGLLCVDLKSRQDGEPFSASHSKYKLDDAGSKVREKVTSLVLTHDGTLWVGTNGNGIYRRQISDEKEHYVNYSTADGLPNDVAHGIAEDPHGNIWVATYHGLSCMKRDGRIINFNSTNGLDTEQFYWNATCRLQNGTLMFGSVDGLLSVKGLVEPASVEPYKVVFTSLKSDNNLVYDTDRMRWEIPENEKAFEISFSALDYTGMSQGNYFYRLGGFEDDWKELPANRNSVQYTNLSPGVYTLEVKYVNAGQSIHTAPVSTFRIEIIPYFYKRWWFILLIILALTAAAWGIYRWRIKDLTRQRNQLRVAVDESVREISQQKNLIEEHARELWQQKEELRLRNEKISTQNAELEEMNHKVNKMTVDRISFFTNLTHEFRTPITLIIGPVERALKLSTNPKVIEQLNFVERNSKYLLSLVNQLMDFRKIEAGKMEIVPKRSNFIKFIDDIILPFKAYAEERGIDLRTVFHLHTEEFSFDQEALRKVLNNLLGNAIKFTPDNGTVTVYAALFKSERCTNVNTLYLSVSDTGCGINEDEIEKVFDRFYQGTSQIKYPLIGASDSGIGLYLCRNIIELYGGKITARNNHGAGCSFRVVIGVPEKDLSEKENMKPGKKKKAAKTALVPENSAQLTILVVEDNNDMRSYIRSILSDYYKVVEAANGVEAMRTLLSIPVDFIISDLMMPDMDGLELLHQVKENFAISHIPFLMLTAKTARESQLEGYRSGIDEYLQKPFDEEMLLVRIKNILDNKARYQQQFIKDLQTTNLKINDDSSDRKFLDKVLEVIRDNYQNSYFEVSDFAEALGVSQSLLNKKLQSLVGESPGQFIRTYRLNMARDFLIENRTQKTRSISEIAFDVGFNDSKYFTRCFTKQFGVSPSSFAKNQPSDGQ